MLATRFYPGQLPAWVNEGIASRRDDEERKATQRREILAWFIRTDNWPSLSEIIVADKIAGSDRSRYTVSASLVEYLLTPAATPPSCWPSLPKASKTAETVAPHPLWIDQCANAGAGLASLGRRCENQRDASSTGTLSTKRLPSLSFSQLSSVYSTS